MGPASLHTVVETPRFVADAKRLMSDGERHELIAMLAANPKAGDLIVGTAGARKLRWARPGEGKSGGYRVITYFGGDDIPVFLLSIFAKNERVNLSKADRNTLAAILSDLADSYRKGDR
jgi:hypothetical protein